MHAKITSMRLTINIRKLKLNSSTSKYFGLKYLYECKDYLKVDKINDN